MSSISTKTTSYLPKWIRVIQYKRLGDKAVMNLKYGMCFFILPAAFSLLAYQPFILDIVRCKGDPEKVEAARRYWTSTDEIYDWKMGQYFYEHPPMFDMAERRKKYPQHYGSRYDGFRKYEV